MSTRLSLRRSRTPGGSPLALALCGLVAVVIGVVVAGALGAAVDIDHRHLVLALAAGGGLGTAYLAITRFWTFVLLLVAVRPTLDLLDQTASGGGLDPAAAVGAVFTGTAVAWLLVQWMQGNWVRTSGVTRSLYALAGAGFASTITSSDAAATVQASFKVLAGALMFGVLEQILAQHPQRSRRLVFAFFASAVVPILFGLTQLLIAPPEPIDGTLSRVHGTFVHPNPFAAFLVLQLLTGLALLRVVERRARIALIGLLAVSGVLLVFTYARGAWIVLALGVAYLGWRGRRELLIALLVVVVAVALAAPSVVARITDASSDVSYGGVPANSFSWRMHYWREVAQLAPENPVSGIGLETVAERMDEGLQPHNVLVQVYVELGALGVASLIVLAFTAVALMRERRRLVAGDRWATDLTDAAGAVAIAVAVLCVSENLLTSTGVYWAVAAATTFGLGRKGARRELASSADQGESVKGGASAAVGVPPPPT